MDIAAGAVVVLCWGCTPLLKKTVGGSLTTHEFSLLNHVIITAVFVLLAVFLFSTGTLDMKNYRNLGRKDYVYACVIAVATVVSSLCLVYLLKKREASVVMAIIQPLAILTTVAVGVLLASEGLTISKLLGCALVCGGVVCLSLKPPEASTTTLRELGEK
jgi:uncharacterized membrane protein